MDNEKSTESIKDNNSNLDYLEISVNKKNKAIFRYFSFKIWMIILVIIIIVVSLILFLRPNKAFKVSSVQDIFYNSENDTYKNAVIDTLDKINPTIVGISNDQNKFYNSDFSNFNVTGIIFDSKGYILAPYDSIKDFDNIYVKFSSRNRKPVRANIVGFNLAYNLVIIKVDVNNLPVVSFGDFSKVRTGDLVVATGAPTGDDITGNVSVGVASFKNKTATYGKLKIDLLQIDAKLTKYNIGGPICDTSGDVIGVNVGVVFENQNIMQDGFVLSSTDIKKVIRDILNNPSINLEEQ